LASSPPSRNARMAPPMAAAPPPNRAISPPPSCWSASGSRPKAPRQNCGA